MIATAKRPKAKGRRSEVRSQKSKRPKINWRTIREMNVPIKPTKEHFRPFDGRPKLCTVTAKIFILRAGEQFTCRVEWESMLSSSGDPQWENRPSTNSETKALGKAGEILLRELGDELRIRAEHRQKPIADALAAAISDVRKWLESAVLRSQLATQEKRLRKASAGLRENAFEWGDALQVILDKKLYLVGHSSFEQYASDVWGKSKSDAYRQMEAARRIKLAAPIAKKLGFQLDAESHFRPLKSVADEDLPHVLQRAAKLVAKRDDGTRRVTAEILTRAVKEENRSEDHTPEDVRRHAAEARAEVRGRKSDVGQETPAASPVRTATPETPVAAATGENAEAVPRPPLGVNLHFAEVLSELGSYVHSLFSTFRGDKQLGLLSGRLKCLSKEAAGIHACRICGCSETDPCDDDDEDSHFMSGTHICGACFGAGRHREAETLSGE